MTPTVDPVTREVERLRAENKKLTLAVIILFVGGTLECLATLYSLYS